MSDSSAAAGVVGILGGMGPLATIDFMHKMLLATPAATDQEHVPVVVSSIPQVPDRNQAFRGDGESPLAALVASGRRLAGAGAQMVVMPCNTAHLWFDELQQALELPMLHLVDAALHDAVALAGPSARIGLLATDASLASGLYLNRRPQGAPAVQWLLPTAREMLDWVMPGIAAVKAGDLPGGADRLLAAALALKQRGASALVLGCTEIPLVLDAANAPLPVIDATAALAQRAVAWSLGQRRQAA
ncbi:MAG TPA: amino acid racemase [Ideonella sp.]|uniref:aspartate/glutamate racemase family protein n=1 Tax=Ideonella sp. TaxID=1929293 RepID=UPI002E36CF19|nr:amino acid racemase [Ideonella sp.]HEX5687639.1 amino acid racemase [Ideonella sp.]